jgi:hypothetical protein
MVNVSTAGANTQTFRLRIVPGSATPAPAHEQVVSVTGGANFWLGTIAVDPGVVAAGTVRAPGGQPLPAYLRASPAGTTEISAETFAGADGAYELRLAFGSYDLLVVPLSTSTAPMRAAGMTAQSIADIALSTGSSVTGTVTSGGGADVAGARVAVTVDGVPSTVGVSTSAGEFSIAARAGSAGLLSIVPPESSGLLSLYLAGAGSIATATAIDVAYAASGSSRGLAVDVLAADGITPLAGARVTFIARPVTAAATVQFDGGTAVAAEGRHRSTALADGSGVASITLPDAIYDIVIEPRDEQASWLSVDLRAGEPSPASLRALAPAILTGRVVDSTGAPVASVDIAALPSAAFGLPGSAPISRATTAADGSFALSASPGLAYELAIAPTASTGLARSRAQVIAPMSGTTPLGDLAVADAISVGGEVSVNGIGGAAGAHVMLVCADCTGSAALTPVAEAITGIGGVFSLAVPDPGVGE